jgi:hypothetical protein
MNVTPIHGIVVTPVWFGTDVLSSSPHGVEDLFMLTCSSSGFHTLMIFIFLYFFIAYFLLVKNTYKNPCSWNPVNSFPVKDFWRYVTIFSLVKKHALIWDKNNNKLIYDTYIRR